MDFTAIDFETATSKYTSACSLGWCVVEDNEIVERSEILIRPEPFEFNKYNSSFYFAPQSILWLFYSNLVYYPS